MWQLYGLVLTFQTIFELLFALQLICISTLLIYFAHFLFLLVIFYFDLLAFDKMIVCTHLCVGHWTNGLTLDCSTQRRVNVDNPFKSPTKCAKQHFFFASNFIWWLGHIYLFIYVRAFKKVFLINCNCQLNSRKEHKKYE